MTDLTPEELANFAPSSNRRGRPRKDDAPIVAWDIRITPCDGEPIDWDRHSAAFSPHKLLACKEVGPDNGKLHYHVYLESRISDTCLTQQIYKVARWTPHYPKGNAVYSKKIAHEGTQGYSVKEGDVACRIGFSDADLDAIVERSAQYRRDLAASKKVKSREAQNTMKQFVSEVVQFYNSNQNLVPLKTDIVSMLLNKYRDKDMMFPSRGPIENATMTIMSRLGDWNCVLNYYTKNM